MKKILAVMAAICAIGCSGPQRSGDPTMTSTSQHDMTNDQLRQKIVTALGDMKAKAVEMGIQGVATASVLNKGETDNWIGVYPGSSWTIVDTEDILGVNLNIKPKR